MKTLNTTSDFKSHEKSFGFIPKLRCSLTIDGIFNLPLDIRKQAFEQPSRLSFKLFFLGLKAEGGKISPRSLTTEELEAQEALAAQTKGKKKEAQIFEDTDFKLPDDVDKEKIQEFFETLENEYSSSSLKFSERQNEPLKMEQELKERDLVCFEECLSRRKTANIYLVVRFAPEEDPQKAKSKSPNAEQIPELRVFSGSVNLDPLLNSESSELQGRFFLSREEKTNELVYAKLSFQVESNLQNDYRQKFCFELEDLLKKEGRPVFPSEIIEKRFSQSIQNVYACFSAEFEKQLNRSGIDLSALAAMGPALSPATDKTVIALKEVSEAARNRAANSSQVKAFRDELSLLMASQVYSKYKIKDLRGVYFNCNDQIYSENFSLFNNLVRNFAKKNLQAFQHKFGFSVPQNSELQNDYFVLLEKTTSKTPAEHFESLAKEYWILGEFVESGKSLLRALQCRQESKSATYFKIYQRLCKKEFAEAETLILNANSKWGEDFEANYRLLLYYIERTKIKEAVFILRFLLEKHENDKLFFLWLSVLCQKYLESSSLGAYFQAKLNFAFERDFSLEVKNSGSQTNLLIQPDELFKYEFNEQKIKSKPAKVEPTNQRTDDRRKTMIAETVVENDGSAQIELLKNQKDDFCLAEANRIFSWGFAKSANLLLEHVNNKEELNYKLLLYKIAKFEDPTNALRQLQELIYSPFETHFQVLFEAFWQLVKIGFVSEEDADKLMEELFESYEKLEDDQKLFLCFHSANILLKRQDFQSAEEIILRSIEFWPNSNSFWLLLGKSQVAKGNQKVALDIFSKANLLDNQNYETLLQIACSLIKNKDIRLQPVLQDLRSLGIQDKEMALQLIAALEKGGFEAESGFFKRNFYGVFPAESV